MAPRRHLRHRHSLSRAFTLIEVLIVIAIIAVLISILLPALAGGREGARKVNCLSNQRQIGMALSFYADEFDGWIPRAAGQVPDVSWAMAYRPYLDPRATWEEPVGDWFREAPYFHDPSRTPDDLHQLHYVNNGLRFDKQGRFRGERQMWRLERGPFPSSTMYLTAYAEDPNNSYYNRIYRPGETDFEISQVYDLFQRGHVDGGENVIRQLPTRHGTGSNVLYLDGHADSRLAGELRKIENWMDHDYALE